MGSQSGQQGCNGNIGQYYDCEDIASWECYPQSVRNDCCVTCNDYKYNITLPISGCAYGDHVPGCQSIVGPNGRQCYNNTIRGDCCEECYYSETDIPGCRYGDRAGMCIPSQCDTYNNQKLYDCCDTCYEEPTSLPTTTTTTDFTTPYYTTSTSPIKGPRDDDLPDWVIPVVASASVVIIIAIIVIVFLICRRKQSMPALVTDEMYKDYKISKRTPIPPPRPEFENNSKLRRQDSAEYAYIHPDDVRTENSNDTAHSKGGSNVPPVPDRPIEDTYLSNPDKYGYFEAEGRKINTDPYTHLETGKGQPDPYTSLSQRSDEESRRQNSYVLELR